MIEPVMFYVFGGLLLAAAVGVITARHPVHAAMFLVLCFVTSAFLWMLLEAEFLAITLVLVYVGAVMVLFLFVVMMLDINFVRMREGFLQYLPVGGLIGVLFISHTAAYAWALWDGDWLRVRPMFWQAPITGVLLMFYYRPTAELAYQAAREEPPRLVLLDVHLPGRTGIELLPDLLALDPAPRVVLSPAQALAAQQLEEPRIAEARMQLEPPVHAAGNADGEGTMGGDRRQAPFAKLLNPRQVDGQLRQGRDQPVRADPADGRRCRARSTAARAGRSDLEGPCARRLR